LPIGKLRNHHLHSGAAMKGVGASDGLSAACAERVKPFVRLGVEGALAVSLMCER